MPRQKHTAKSRSSSEKQYKDLIHHHTLMIRSAMPHIEKLPKLRRAFLRAFAETLSIAESTKRIGRDPDTHYYWLQTDPLYAESFEYVKTIAIQGLEDEAVRRAKEGYLVPVVSGGKVITYVRKYSDKLLITLLKRFKPEAYKTQSTRKLTVAGDGPADVNSRSAIGKAVTVHLEALRGAEGGPLGSLSGPVD